MQRYLQKTDGIFLIGFLVELARFLLFLPSINFYEHRRCGGGGNAAERLKNALHSNGFLRYFDVFSHGTL